MQNNINSNKMTFLKFVSIVTTLYTIYYLLMYAIEVSKSKKSTTANQKGSVVYAISPEKIEPMAIAGNQASNNKLENQIPTVEQTALDEKKK